MNKSKIQKNSTGIENRVRYTFGFLLLTFEL